MTYVTVAEAGNMSRGTLRNTTLTLTSDSYVVLDEVQMNSLTGVFLTLYSTTQSINFKVEYTKNGVTWYTAAEDIVIAAAGSYGYSQKTNATRVRVSAKPTVAGVYGTATIGILLVDFPIEPEFATGYAYEAISATTSSAVTLTQANHSYALLTLITVEDAAIRWTVSGLTPTSTIGHYAPIGTTLKVYGSADLIHFQAIGIGGTASLRVTYSR